MYTTNPRMPRLRAKAVNMVLSGKSVSSVARYFGYSKSAVSKWVNKSPTGGVNFIPTVSSRPHHHPRELSKDVVGKIIAYKKKYNRCSDVIHQHLINDGIHVSLNSVKRKLDYAGLIKKRSPWKRLHKSIKRPQALKPGDLVMVDTIHLMINERKRIYVYTLIDVYSRWCYALATDKISAGKSVDFLKRAGALADFKFKCIQSDNGSEFSQHFSERIKTLHRHSRVRKPNDNSYVERFNRTLQEECLDKLPTNVRIFNRALPTYLNYYNTERLHMGIEFKTPNYLINCFQAIG
ncbi:MAG: integrase core domain-containing protein [Candidatus Moranbacteria bacterium]|nr:integrase core domain-containing protein [Candidatus Moranbacteria bacterium]